MTKDEKIDLIKRALDNIRPFLQEDDGDIEFVDLTDDDILKIRYAPVCKTCRFKERTKFIIEKQLRRFYPDLKGMLEVD